MPDPIIPGSYVSTASRNPRHHHTTKRYKIVFSSVTMNAHGSNLIGGSAKLATPKERSTYHVEAIVRLLRLQVTAQARVYTNPPDKSTSLRATDDGDNAYQPTATRAGDSNLDDQGMDMEEDPATTDGPNPHHKNPRSNGNKCAPPSAAPRKSHNTHLLRTTTSNVLSPLGSPSDQPPSSR
jgi:hypothetical protein